MFPMRRVGVGGEVRLKCRRVSGVKLGASPHGHPCDHATRTWASRHLRQRTRIHLQCCFRVRACCRDIAADISRAICVGSLDTSHTAGAHGWVCLPRAMEDGTGTLPGGSDDHHDDTSAIQEDDNINTTNNATTDSSPGSDGMKLPWSSSAPTSPVSPPTSPTSPPRQQSHRRTVSGSLLGRLNFLRNVGNDTGRPPSRDRPPSREKDGKSPREKSFDDDVAVVSPVKELREDSAMSSALKQSKTQRKRKGSLRKTALLGGKMFNSEGRERKGSLLQRSPTKQTPSPASSDSSPEKATAPSPSIVHFDTVMVAEEQQHETIRRQFSYESSLAPSSSTDNSTWSEPAAVTAARLSLVTNSDTTSDSKASGEGSLQSPLDLKSPTSQASYTSTTDDDDILTFDRPSVNSALLSSSKKPVPPPSGSYFPPPSAISSTSHSDSRSRSRTHRPSPLTHTPLRPPYPPSPPEPYDYTETAYWGWVLLAVTWIVFTVGMGSCLDVWSWAWDVPEKPYAPPELEDDPTLPIVGYYPALIVLTGVVSWVWISVAWLGMKYFRHARVEV